MLDVAVLALPSEATGLGRDSALQSRNSCWSCRAATSSPGRTDLAAPPSTTCRCCCSTRAIACVIRPWTCAARPTCNPGGRRHPRGLAGHGRAVRGRRARRDADPGDGGGRRDPRARAWTSRGSRLPLRAARSGSPIGGPPRGPRITNTSPRSFEPSALSDLLCSELSGRLEFGIAVHRDTAPLRDRRWPRSPPEPMRMCAVTPPGDGVAATLDESAGVESRCAAEGAPFGAHGGARSAAG